MINLFCATLAFMAVFPTDSAEYERLNTLVVSIQNINSSKGNIHVALYDAENNFLKTHLQGRTTSADKGSVHIFFEGLAPGEYALAVIHDSNENGVLDTNLLGMPKEGFGFSNDGLGRFGPPAFDKVKFTWCGERETVVVRLKYL